MIASWADVNANALRLLTTKAIEHLIVESDKTAQQSARRIKLQ
jgi:hypothetical protein